MFILLSKIWIAVFCSVFYIHINTHTHTDIHTYNCPQLDLLKCFCRMVVFLFFFIYLIKLHVRQQNRKDTKKSEYFCKTLNVNPWNDSVRLSLNSQKPHNTQDYLFKIFIVLFMGLFIYIFMNWILTMTTSLWEHIFSICTTSRLHLDFVLLWLFISFISKASHLLVQMWFLKQVCFVQSKLKFYNDFYYHKTRYLRPGDQDSSLVV